jgi:hypothetical protein
MPRPNDGETREDFIARYMSDAEARRSYPEAAQRYKIAESLWENRNALAEAANALGYNEEREGAEPFEGFHLEPGLVGYPEMKHPVHGTQGVTLLVEKPVVDAMRDSARGMPVLNWKHETSSDSERWIKDGKAVGVMTRSFWNGEAGKEACEFFLWDREAKANARGGFRLSNAWRADDVDWTPGVHNGMPYDGRLKAAHYTHLAIVPNPRYEGAVIYANAEGGLKAMLKLFGIGKSEAVELDKEAALKVGEKSYTALEVVNAITKMEAAAAPAKTTAKEGVLTEKDTIEVGGKKYSHAEVMNALKAAEAPKVDPITPKKEPVAAAAPSGKVEFANQAEFEAAVDARLKAQLGDLAGDNFFNAVAKLAQLRPTNLHEAPAPGRQSERDRVARGKEKYGERKRAAAAA